MRFVVWELNGFPRWFEPLYRAYPIHGHTFVWAELRWELENCPADTSLHYILSDIVYHAPWLHAELVGPLCDWLNEHQIPNTNCLRYCRHILVSGGGDPASLANLARTKVLAFDTPSDQFPIWYALWVDTAPGPATTALETRLTALGRKDASVFAQAFVVALVGSRREIGPSIGAFRKPEHLKTLHILMHRYIRMADDIDRADTGVYSPSLRDDAQDARNALFSLLCDIPGEATYKAILELAEHSSEPKHRAHMGRQARQRAITDSDLPRWSNKKFRHFSKNMEDKETGEI